MMNDGIDKCSFGKERREEGHAGLSSSVFLSPVLPAVGGHMAMKLLVAHGRLRIIIHAYIRTWSLLYMSIFCHEAHKTLVTVHMCVCVCDCILF